MTATPLTARVVVTPVRTRPPVPGVATLLAALCATVPARAQVAPWSEPPPPWPSPPRVAPARPAPREVRPVSNERVVTQVTVGLFAVAGGMFVGGLAGLPLASTGSEEAFFVVAYTGGAFAAAGAVTGLGRAFRGDGEFGSALLGAVVGASVGWALHFGAFDRATEPSLGGAAALTGVLTVTGAVAGYALSASSAEDIAAGARRRARLAPSLTPLRDGAVLGLAGAL